MLRLFYVLGLVEAREVEFVGGGRVSFDFFMECFCRGECCWVEWRGYYR